MSRHGHGNVARSLRLLAIHLACILTEFKAEVGRKTAAANDASEALLHAVYARADARIPHVLPGYGMPR